MKEAVFVVDKEPGPTSFDVVRQVKRLFPGVKVGHSGSLDPFASGVLVLLLGRATKLSGLLLNADKEYDATLLLGTATDAMDRTGKVVQELPVPPLDAAAVASCLQSFVGTWNQVPPMFSAKKVQGVRLYQLARKNIEIVREAVPVQLHKLELERFESPEVQFRVACSKGTYIRSLAAEVASKLGTCGHLTGLRRTACGSYRLEEAETLAQIAEDPAGALRRGYANYVRLVREEMLARRRQGSARAEGAALAAP